MAVYGYDDATLQGVINATDTALQNMGSVNQNVMGIQGLMPVVNKSTSGVKLATALADWTTDFNLVKNQLDALNNKAKGLLTVNRGADTDADSTANGAH